MIHCPRAIPGRRLARVRAAKIAAIASVRDILLPPGLTMEPATAAEMPEANVDRADVEVRRYSLLSSTGNWAGQRTPFYLLPGLDVEISASRIREQARAQAQDAGGSYLVGHELVPDAVSDYIQRRGLYR